MSNQATGNGALMTDGDLAALKAKLDLPDHVLEFLRQQPRLNMQKNFVGTFAGIMVLAGLASILAIFPIAAVFLSDFGQSLVKAGLLPEDTLLFHQGSDALTAALVIAALAGLFLAAYLFHLAIRLNPSLYYRSIASNLDPTIHISGRPHPKHEGVTLHFVKWLLRGISKRLPPKEYLKRYERRFAGLWARPALILYLTALVLFAFEVKSISRVTPRGVEISPAFSASFINYSWKNIVGIGTGCSSVSRRARSSHAVQYYLRFDDDRLVNLGSYSPLNTRWLDAIETVDRKLAKLGIPKVAGDFDARCLKAKRRSYGPDDFDRLRRILRSA